MGRYWKLGAHSPREIGWMYQLFPSDKVSAPLLIIVPPTIFLRPPRVKYFIPDHNGYLGLRPLLKTHRSLLYYTPGIFKHRVSAWKDSAFYKSTQTSLSDCFNSFYQLSLTIPSTGSPQHSGHTSIKTLITPYVQVFLLY